MDCPAFQRSKISFFSVGESLVRFRSIIHTTLQHNRWCCIDLLNAPRLSGVIEIGLEEGRACDVLLANSVLVSRHFGTYIDDSRCSYLNRHGPSNRPSVGLRAISRIYRLEKWRAE